LPIERLIIGTNTNDILTRFMETGAMDAMDVVPTLSPAMDIQVSSNFERLLFDLHGRDGRVISQAMTAFRESGTMAATNDLLDKARELFSAARLDDAGIKAQIAATYKNSGMIVDPHTATGLHAAMACAPDPSVPVVALSTAHPAKFPDAVEAAIGVRPSLPSNLVDLLERPERLDTLPNDLAIVQAFVSDRAINT
jgi:threonine synthase